MFTVYYWVQQGDKRHAICERLHADSMDAATVIVQEKLTHHSFTFDSESEGRVIILSAHVQYAEIEGGVLCNLSDRPVGF